MNPAENWRNLYPFRSHELTLDGLRYHYLDEPEDRSTLAGNPAGTAAAPGGPLLLVHGNPTWSFYWRNLVLAWRDRWRVVVPDHIGCGLSDKPAEYNYTLAQHARNLLRLVESLDLKNITLVAHDWGGAIGLSAALAASDRFARIVLMNTGAFPPPFFPWRIRVCRTPILGPAAVRGLNLFARAALWMASAHPERLTPAVRAGLLAPYDNWAHRVAIQRFVDDIPQSPRHPTWRVLADLEAGLPRLADRPVQLIWGMRDWCFRPECLTRFEQIFPAAEVHRFDDAGHYVVEDAHERIGPLVAEFITGQSSVVRGQLLRTTGHGPLTTDH
ncbi:MAG: alpha/beta fold hydrolase [Planctomycetia bacterium]|nr:alpha/beta fold hydrolase [Planctomycetia bacterium]